MKYKAVQSEYFSEERAALSKQHDKQITNLIKEIIEDPIRKSLIMQEDFEGLRRRAKGRIRILFSVCGDCRKHDE